MSCEENPFFVIVKKTGTGFSFDNDVTYKSPFATHTLSQAAGVLHPSLRVQSDWGIKSKNTITQLLTGQAGAKIVRTGRGHLGSSDLLVKERVDKKTGKKTVVSRFGLLAPTLNNKGYTLTRIGDRNEGLSVAELAKLLNDIAKRPGDIKVRGSPLEYKRLLDYIQFLMVEKVSKTVNNSNGNPVQNDLYLARPNNYQVMEAVHTDGISLEEAYSGMKVEDSKMYSKAYFVTMDRVAALASVVRQIPTIYQTGDQYYYNVPTSNVIPKIRTILATRLEGIGYTIPTDKKPMNHHPNRTQELITPKTREHPAGRPVITTGPLFAWFLNTRNIGEKTNKNGKRIVGSNFHKLDDREKALILFYWVFHYPDESGGKGVNEQVIKHFLAILDTFHDFTDTKRTANFNGLWPESKNPNVYSNAKAKTRNGINNRNIPSTSIQHKFLVKLLGIDIYRKVDTYNNSLTQTLSKTNRRDGTSNQRQPNIPVQLRVAHFLYFITNVLGSHPSRGLIGKCEELSRYIMIKLSNDESVNQPVNLLNTSGRKPGENICKTLLEGKNACLVIDAINGSVPACMKKYSVFHNVGLLDPADKGILPWGEVIGEGGCVESARVKAAKRKREKERMAAKKASKTRAERAAKAKATRAQRIKNEAAAKKRNANLAAIRAKQASNRRNALAAKRQATSQNQILQVNKLNNTTKAKFNALGNMRMNKPKMESFKLFLNTGNVNNETVKNLLNRITYNKNKYNRTDKQIIRNVLNKILRRGKNDNLNRKAINLKSTMFANNVRQLRNRQR